MNPGIVTASYIGATILFILALGGLSHPESSRRGNLYGIIGMFIALVVTIAGITANIGILIGGLLIGGSLGLVLAKRVQMTEMPELVAILHSLVGMAAVLVGFANFMDPASHFKGVELTIHDIETSLGVIIGAVTFSGSVIAFGKLSGKITGNPMLIPGRHWFNLGLLIATIYFCKMFVDQSAAGHGGGLTPLLIITGIAMLFGIHMVMAIGGADMPVVVSMLNSYSGWAAAATGFMLNNDLLIVVGALVGSSGAILSYIMCRAMNRKFLAVIAGGFGTTTGAVVGGGVGVVSGGAGGAALGAVAGAMAGALIGAAITDRERFGPDGDGDGVADTQDNCPDVANRDQQDIDGDGHGDPCPPVSDPTETP